MLNRIYGSDLIMNGTASYSSERRNRYELINGETYMMSSPGVSHVRVNGNLHKIFGNYLAGKRCEPFNQFNVFFSETDHFIPDEIIVCNPDIVEDDVVHGTPDLVVEILSKSTARKDKNEKFFKYEQYGVKEYWIVDPFSKSVDVYHLINDKLVRDEFTYALYTDIEFKQLDEEEKAESKFYIKVSIYDDFYVKLDDIFDRVK